MSKGKIDTDVLSRRESIDNFVKNKTYTIDKYNNLFKSLPFSTFKISLNNAIFFGMYKTYRTGSINQDLLLSGSISLFSTTLTYPLDTIKVYINGVKYSSGYYSASFDSNSITYIFNTGSLEFELDGNDSVSIAGKFQLV